MPTRSGRASRCTQRKSPQNYYRYSCLSPMAKLVPVPNVITDVSCSTRKWRSAPTWTARLPYSATSAMDADTFRKGIEVYATQITAELLSVQLSVATGETCPCPKCGSGRILFYPKVAKCSNVDCTLTIFRNKCDKQLSDKQIVELATKRKTGLIKGFKGKNGKTFDASLVLDGEFNVAFSFPEKKGKPKK
ncbi:dNA topoisomerase I [Tannerella sp. CAG:118]|nr:dNA topoisomerase I [Tannerella sp. CAG:118]